MTSAGNEYSQRLKRKLSLLFGQLRLTSNPALTVTPMTQRCEYESCVWQTDSKDPFRLISHAWKAHRVEAKLTSTALRENHPSTVFCFGCKCIFKTKHTLDLHLSSSSHRADHEEAAALQEQGLMCDHCLDTFVTTSNVELHKLACMGSDVPTFNDPEVALKRSRDQGDQSEATEAAESDQPAPPKEPKVGPLVCDKCNNVFTRTFSLQRHKCINTEYTEACEICHQEIRKDNMKRHLRTHDPLALDPIRIPGSSKMALANCTSYTYWVRTSVTGAAHRNHVTVFHDEKEGVSDSSTCDRVPCLTGPTCS